MTTKKRRARKEFNRILMKYGIDDLNLEIDLVASAMELFDVKESLEFDRVGTSEALKRHERKKESDGVDVSHYPEDVRPVIAIVCNLWSLRPPIRIKGGEYASWIKCARSIIDACGEYDAETVIDTIRIEYEEQKRDAYGIAPYTVSGPCSLMKLCRAKSGQIREKENERISTDVSDSKQSSFSF